MLVVERLEHAGIVSLRILHALVAQERQVVDADARRFFVGHRFSLGSAAGRAARVVWVRDCWVNGRRAAEGAPSSDSALPLGVQFVEQRVAHAVGLESAVAVDACAAFAARTLAALVAAPRKLVGNAKRETLAHDVGLGELNERRLEAKFASGALDDSLVHGRHEGR